jgi:hypothetical protein
LQQLRFGCVEDGGRIAEVFEQLPHPDRADVLDQIQRHQGFPRLHASEIAGLLAARKWKSGDRG